MNNGNEIFDARRIKRLVDLMRENDLTELDLQNGDVRVQLKRNGIPVAVQPAATAPISLAPIPVATEQPKAAPTEEKNVYIITSPMVGTFYAASTPNDPPFISLGDMVQPEKTVCLIEAMKVYNEIQAECSGKVLAVLIKNGQTVEFGTPLFKISTAISG